MNVIDKIWNQLESIAESSDGVLRTAQVEQAGISRPMLKKYVDMGKLERVRKGIYQLSDRTTDEYALLQAQNSKAILSYGTALYLWGLSDRTPHILDITVPAGTNTMVIRRDNTNLRCHYVRQEMYEMGITQTQSPQGAMVRLYDRERCICDIVKDKSQIELQLYSQALNRYFKGKPDSRRLLKYSRILGIENKVRTYMEVLL